MTSSAYLSSKDLPISIANSSSDNNNRSSVSSSSSSKSRSWWCCCCCFFFKSWKRFVISLVTILVTIVLLQSYWQTSSLYELSSLVSSVSSSSMKQTTSVPVTETTSVSNFGAAGVGVGKQQPQQTMASRRSPSSATAATSLMNQSTSKQTTTTTSTTATTTTFTPQQVWNDDEKCIPTQKYHKNHKVESFPVYDILNDFIQGDGLLYETSTTTTTTKDTTTTTKLYAICEFQDDEKHLSTRHFTHTMQQLYGCWSFWFKQVTNGVDVIQPLLLLSTGIHKRIVSYPFINGFLSSLQNNLYNNIMDTNVDNNDTSTLTSTTGSVQVMNLLIIGRAKFVDTILLNNNNTTTTTNNDNVVHNYYPTSLEEIQNDKMLLPSLKISVKGGYAPIHGIQYLRHVVRTYYNISTTTASSSGFGLLDDDDHDDDKKTSNNSKDRLLAQLPRIAILNRRKSVGRSILNADRLAMKLQKVIYNTTESNHHVIPVMYFEGKSFQEQIEFYSNVDILISSHGAQLTGLPFMGRSLSSSSSTSSLASSSLSTSCIGSDGTILELFPKGYLIPDFFGSLAVHSKLSYGYMYLSDGNGNPSTEQATNLLTRIKARATNLCPKISTIVDTTQVLVDEWKKEQQTARKRSRECTTTTTTSTNT